MAKAVSCSGEIHPLGGGVFLLGHSEELCLELVEKYHGQVQLIYLDPPFGTGASFKKKDAGGDAPAYRDDMRLDEQLTLMRRILTACHELLGPAGALYLHIDYRLCADMRMLLNEIFGRENFVNEIIWAYKSGGRAVNHFSRKHDNILFYRKSPQMFFNIKAVGAPRGPERRNHMKREVDAAGRIYYTIRANNKTYAYYEDSPVYPSDVWDDIEHLHQRDPERTGYGTQKPAALLERIIRASSREGDLVMDLFSGSGTTADTARALKREWIVADSSPASLLSTRVRILRAYNDMPLFSGDREMRVVYKETPPEGGFEFDIQLDRSSGGVRAQLAGFSGSAAPAYLALGYIEDGMFRPLACELAPKVGRTLLLRYTGAVTVQLSDAAGCTRFIEYAP